MTAPVRWWRSRFAADGILPIVAVACMAAGLLPPSTAIGQEAEEAAAITTAGIRLGNLVSGPARSPESLAHRVVVLEFWGVNCPPCIKSMPALESLHRQLGPAGLVVIGAHAQDATPAEIKEVVDERGVTFTIVENANVAGAMDFTGIPHCLVFDHTGACIYRGHPARADDVIVGAVRSSPAAVLEGRELKKLAAIARQLRDESAFAAVLKRAESLSRSADPETASEAAYVAEKLKAYGQRLLDGARDAEAENPVRAVSLAQRCVAAYRGTDTGTQAAALLREWTQDRRFQDSLKAARQCGQLEAARTRILRALGNPQELTPELVGQVPKPLRKQLADTVASIHDLSPGSAAATRADEIADGLGVTVSP